MFLARQGRTLRGIPRPGPGTSWTETLCKVPLSVVLDREWPGCPEIWVGTSRDQKDSMQENFGLSFVPSILEQLQRKTVIGHP